MVSIAIRNYITFKIKITHLKYLSTSKTFYPPCIFIEKIICNHTEDGSFTIRGEDVNSLADLYGRFEELRSLLRNNYDNIVTNKLEN